MRGLRCDFPSSSATGNRTDRSETNAGLTKRDQYTCLADDQLDIVKYNYTGTTQDRTVDYNYDATGNRTAGVGMGQSGMALS